MSSKYTDITAIMQVIGNVFNNPSLLDETDKYTITDEDFPDQFHKIVFGSIFKLHELGAKQISLTNINDFLATRPKSEAVYKSQKGDEWLLKVVDSIIPDSFNYYYDRLKKFIVKNYAKNSLIYLFQRMDLKIIEKYNNC